MTYAKRVDANQTEIVAAFRKMGCKVFVTSSVGNGYPDLLVGVSNMAWHVEVKDGSKPLSQQKLTPAEKLFHEDWGFCTIIITSVDEAIAFVNMVRSKHVSQ